MQLGLRKGTRLNRKDLRKLKRKEKKHKKHLFLQKKKTNNIKNSTHLKKNDDKISKIKKKSINKQQIKSKSKTKKGKKTCVDENKSNMFLKINDTNKKYNLLAEQKKDDELISYLQKKLKITDKGDSNNKHDETKFLKSLEKDGFDSTLLKLTDAIFNDFQKNVHNKTKSSKKNKKIQSIDTCKENENDEILLDNNKKLKINKTL
ncbi:conserved protein, unknown function, partial [Hepatocystis sp. ex Piliocolobus tephrosceles]